MDEKPKSRLPKTMKEIHIESQALKKFKPFAGLTEEQVILLSEKITVKQARPGKKLLKRGSDSEEAFFLVDGQIELKNANGDKRLVEAGSEEALSAIAQLKPRAFQVTSKSEVTYLTLSDEHLKFFISQTPNCQRVKGPFIDDESEDIISTYQEILVNIYEDYKNNRLSIPSLPDAALRIRRMVDDDTATVNKIAQALSLEPSLSANIVRVVNSPLYRTRKEIRSVQEAVVRLGLNTTKNLVINFSLRNIFVPKSKLVKTLMIENWSTSVLAATFCYVAAKSQHLDPEEALLGGLLHRIGAIPVLQYAELYDELLEEKENLHPCINELKAPLGAFLLERWQFPETLVDCARLSNSLERTLDGPVTMTDLCIVGQALTQTSPALPDAFITQLPAYKKMFGGQSDIKAGREIQDQANKELSELRNMLSVY